jgi:hypothetical protein
VGGKRKSVDVRKGVIALAVLLLAGCSFGSEEPLFNERDGFALFGDGQTVRMTEHPTGSAEVMTFVRDGDAYLMSPPGETQTMRIFFAPITSTPEEDYIAQLRISREGQGVAYAFVWRYGDRLRAISAPNGVSETSPDSRFCRMLELRQCQFESREDAIGYYRETIYPRFVVGDEAANAYIDLTPEVSRPQK